MSTHQVTEALLQSGCRHLSKKQTRPGREVCEDCGTKFLSGIAQEAWPEEIHKFQSGDVAPESPEIDEEDGMSSLIAKMPSKELHGEIVRTYEALGGNISAYSNLTHEARARMAAGQTIGECSTWTDYVDRYLRRFDQTLPTCLRSIRRTLEGKNPDTKHRNNRKKATCRTLNELFEEKENETEIADENKEKLMVVKEADHEEVSDNNGKLISESLVAQSEQLADKLAEYVVLNISEDGTTNLAAMKTLLGMAQQYLAQRQKGIE